MLSLAHDLLLIDKSCLIRFSILSLIVKHVSICRIGGICINDVQGVLSFGNVLILATFASFVQVFVCSDAAWITLMEDAAAEHVGSIRVNALMASRLLTSVHQLVMALVVYRLGIVRKWRIVVIGARW